MAESLQINTLAALDEQYVLLIKQIKSLLNKNDHLITNLANLTAALKQTFSKISWVGFYLFDGEKLFLGPFQGKVACTEIKIGSGVCGTAAQKKQTIIVSDVNKFDGHIACDVDSKSEIVVPVFKDGKLFGVLDLDSTDFDSFNETDKKYLEELSDYLSKEII
ncbi:MAG: GAF domain-containing protein [Ignavibacteriota bacterium]|jgi:GAF domain-containing protein|nr:GAF domain-containing protein [Ignavibacteriota bacterium]MBW7842172.1 GAF domain-containing protein [Ignavibacterium sp.]MCO6446176.1 GAF domain-containing protein [Ignavibacterium album]MCZ2268371.1 GAF domain-containing protein [Ignavibacteriales bacterium]MDX9713049.1 GAF domain-containing protein [Ignavibacteriaceae bacterium]